MRFEVDEQDKAQIASNIALEVMKALNPVLFKHGPSQDVIYTVETLAAYLQTTPKWVYSHMPELPHFKKDGLLRFRKQAIDRLFDEIPSKRPGLR